MPSGTDEVDEYVVFIAPTEWQLKAMGRVLHPEVMARVLRGGEYDKQPLGYSEHLSAAGDLC